MKKNAKRVFLIRKNYYSRRRPQPDRAGYWVRLLLCTCGVGVEWGWLWTIMINCNPETVSTDFDTSDRLYFESLTLEDVLEIVHIEKPKGLLFNTAARRHWNLPVLWKLPVCPLLVRRRIRLIWRRIGNGFKSCWKDWAKTAANATARSVEQAVNAAKELGYPLVVRPSYVWVGGEWKSFSMKKACSVIWKRLSAFLTMPRIAG